MQAMRLMHVRYDFTDDVPLSPQTGKSPYIEWAGETISDTKLIIDRIISTSGVDPDATLPLREQAISRCVCRTLEESTYWYLVLQVQENIYSLFDI